MRDLYLSLSFYEIMKFNFIIDLDSTNGKLWFSSDFHLGHNNVLKHCCRPYKSAQENIDDVKDKLKKVLPNDYLILLGDNIWTGQVSRINSFFRGINTRNIIVFYGNHDREKNYKDILADGTILAAERLGHIRVRKEGKEQEIALCHYPLLTWNGKARNAWMIHGHCHGNIDKFNNEQPDLRVDVGWDSELALYDLVEYSDLQKFFQEKTKRFSCKSLII